MRAYRKSILSFGLVNAPVCIYNATRKADVSFSLCDKDGNKVEQVYRTSSGKILSRDECERAYEGVKISSEAITAINEACAVDAQGNDLKKSLTIDSFIPLDKVPMHRVTGWYYVGADPKAPVGPYAVIIEAMAQQGVAAVCKWVPNSRQQMLILYPREGVLHGVTVAMHHEIVADDETLHVHDKVSVDSALVEQAGKLIGAYFDPEASVINSFEDEALSRRQQLISDALSGKEISTPTPAPANTAGDMMDALKASLDQAIAERPKPKSRKRATA